MRQIVTEAMALEADVRQAEEIAYIIESMRSTPTGETERGYAVRPGIDGAVIDAKALVERLREAEGSRKAKFANVLVDRDDVGEAIDLIEALTSGASAGSGGPDAAARYAKGREVRGLLEYWAETDAERGIPHASDWLDVRIRLLDLSATPGQPVQDGEKIERRLTDRRERGDLGYEMRYYKGPRRATNVIGGAHFPIADRRAPITPDGDTKA